MTRRHQHTPARSASASSVACVGASMLNDDQRHALQTLLFNDGPEHSLGEGVDRYRAEILDVPGTLAPRTVDWMTRACARLRDWHHRPIRGRFRDVGIELYKRYQLTLSCGCVLTRTANRRPKSGRARCEVQPQCKWRVKEVADAG